MFSVRELELLIICSGKKRISVDVLEQSVEK